MPSAPAPICTRCRRIKGKDCQCAKRGPDRRESRHKRGYSNDWAVFAKRFKAEHPLCQDCEENGIARAAEETHHIKKLVDHPELKFDESNLRNLCKPCHSRRTGRGE